MVEVGGRGEGERKSEDLAREEFHARAKLKLSGAWAPRVGWKTKADKKAARKRPPSVH